MRQALHAALMHAQTNTRCAHIGCSLLIDGRFIMSTSNCPSAHAEQRIFQRICKNYANIDLIVVRVKKEPFGKLAMAKPCKDCVAFCKSLGIRGVYYSTEVGKIQYELVKDMKNDHMSKSHLR